MNTKGFTILHLHINPYEDFQQQFDLHLEVIHRERTSDMLVIADVDDLQNVEHQVPAPIRIGIKYSKYKL